MLIHNLVATGSISYNGVNISYVTGSQTSLDGLNQFSASVNTTTGSLNSTTGSLNTATGSLFTASGSFSTRVTNIEGNYATTGSNVFLGAQTVCANITSTGTIIAQTLNVQQVTSSIVYSSGSNVFGNQLTDVQQFTGSLRVTGSGNNYFLGGNVGIGTSSPTYDLTLSKSVAAGNVVLNLENTSTTGAARLWFGNNASSTGARIQYFGATHAARPSLFSIGTDAANDMMFETSGTERARITSTGIACFACQVCAPNVSIINCLGVGTAAGAGYILDVYQPASSTTAYARIKNNRTRNAALQFETNCGNYLFGVGIGTDTNRLMIYDNNAGATRLTLDQCGNVGLSTTPAAWVSTARAFQINAHNSISSQHNGSFNIMSEAYESAANTFAYSTTGGYPTRINMNPNDGVISIFNAPTGTATNTITWCERMRITSDGCVGIGTPSPNGLLHIQQCRGGEVGFRITNSQGASADTSATVAINMTLQNGSGGSSGVIQLIAGKESDHQTAANVDDYFAITTTSNDTTTERMRITSGGNVLINCSCNGSGQLQVNGAINNTGTGGMALGSLAGRRRMQWDTGANNEAIILGDNDGYFPIGASAFNVRSDYRLKEDLREFEALSIIDRIRTYDFKWKDKDERNYGMIAHEVQCVLPYIVSGVKDAINEEENKPSYQGMDYSKLTPILVKAIQEQQCKINILESCLGIN